MARDTVLFAGIAGYVGRPDAVGGTGVFRRTIAASDRWTNVLPDLDAHVVVVHPEESEVVLAGTADGVYRSTDGGVRFRRSDFPERGRGIWSLLPDASDPRRLYAGASPVGVFLSEDLGASWRALPDPGLPTRLTAPFDSRVMRLAQHPLDAQTLYAALEFGGAMVSRDGGERWSDCGETLASMARQPHLASQIVSDSTAEGMLDGHALTTTPADPEAVTLALRMGLFESRDGGRSWRDKDVASFSPTTYGREIRTAPSAPGTLYCALSVAAASEDGGVYRSTDAGRTWSRFDRVQVHGTIMSLGLHPEDAGQVYIGARYRGEIFGTRDGGESWDTLSIPGEVKDLYCVACG